MKKLRRILWCGIFLCGLQITPCWLCDDEDLFAKLDDDVSLKEETARVEQREKEADKPWLRALLVGLLWADNR